VLDTVIQVENLAKKYILSHQQEEGSNYKTLRDVITRGTKSLAKELLQPADKKTFHPTREEFWALKAG
jgi:lipopolysaccharide transport system ATP-binding protein